MKITQGDIFWVVQQEVSLDKINFLREEFIQSNKTTSWISFLTFYKRDYNK